METGLILGWLRLARRRWRTGALLFVVVAAVGVTVVLTAHPVYRAESKLRLGEPPPMSGVSPTAGFFGLLRLGGDPFANDLELLASRSLAESVVDDATLHVILSAPRGWHRDSLFESLSAGRATRRARYRIEWREDAVLITPPRGAALRAVPGQPVTFGDVRVVFRPWHEGMPREVELKTISHAEAARLLTGRLAVARTNREANVARLRYQDTDPRLVRDVVSSAVTRFVELRTHILQRESGETVDSLRSVAARTRVELIAAEKALETVQRTTGLVAPDAQSDAAVERFSELTAQLELSRIELRALTAALDRSFGETDAAQSWSTLLSYPRFLENETVSSLLTRLTELEGRRRELARLRTEQNLEHRAVIDQIAYLDQSLRTVAVDFRGTLQAEVAALEEQVTRLRQQLAAVPAQALELGRKQRDLRVLTEMVVITEQRLRQEELRQALTFANVQIIDPPALRDRPVWPRRKVGPAVALLLAGATALLGMLVVDRADTRVRTATEVRAALGAPVLGVVVRERGGVVLPADDAAAVVRRAAIEPGGIARLGVTDVSDGSVARLVCDAIVSAAALVTREPLAAAHVELLPVLRGFGAAAAAAASRLPIVIAVDVRSTSHDALKRAAALLTEAGADVAGAVLVCRSAKERAEVWS